MSHKAHVLIAEDGAAERQLLQWLLQPEGYRLTVVDNGVAAVAAYQANGADVLLVDWLMPEMDGLEVVRKVRALAAAVPPYIIMLTARIDRDDLVTCLNAGADDYLTKPFDRRELLARIRGGARIQQLMRELWRNNDLLRRMAMTDSLTGLPNRRAFEEWLSAERVFPDGPRTFAVIMADLDHFKAINDGNGHLVGDAVLREAAERLRAALRPSDFIARFGGDEFVFGLPDCNRADAEGVADRVRAGLREAPFVLPDGNIINLCITTGIAVFPDDGAPADLIAVADRALFLAKAARLAA